VGSVLETRQRGLSNAEVVAVLQRYGGLIQRWVSRIASDRADAEDAYHEVFLKLLIYGAQFRGLATEADRHRWLKTLAVRVCLTRRSKARRYPELPAPPVEYAVSAHDGEARTDLVAFWNSLKQEERVIGVLYFEEGYTHEEIHELTGRGRPFLAKTLSTIREKLARRGH
jgi:RNA polymerase sigma factor (sigma-70 family)